MSSDYHHTPVLLRESLAHLAIQPEGTYVDLTFGGGGHARHILDQLKGGSLWAFDQDEAARREAEKINDPRFHFIQGNFRFFTPFLRAQGITQVDGILADLGISSHQLDQEKRGFAARLEGPLDMRMYQGAEETAADLLNKSSLAELTHIFRLYSDIRNAYKLAQTLIARRKMGKITTTQELVHAIENCILPKRRYQYLAKVFQALRIAVNDEMGALEEMLQQLPNLLAPNGRVVILSYHSGEDRLVKRFFQYGNIEGKPQKDFYGNLSRPLRPLQRQVGKPTEEEITRNNRARSARLRAAEKVLSEKKEKKS